MKNIKNVIKEYGAITVLTIVMAVYYGVELFANKPWYDELYTYYYFISRGPVYAAIHWPVPNNHMGYSVLSAILDYTGNNYIGLRGISWIASVASIVLCYILGKKFFSKAGGMIISLSMCSFYLVNSLAIQGRGYALSTTLFLIAGLCVYDICLEKEKTWKYIVFALSMAYALYCIPSNCYWVVTICLVGGAYTLLSKQYKKMRKLIYFGLAAAFMTFCCYGTVWLAIGSNLLSKDAQSAYYNVYQVSIIKANPLLAMKTGMDYMLATPYIQSMDRGTVIRELPQYLKDLFELYIEGCGSVIILLMIVAMLVAVSMLFVKKEGKELFVNLFIILFTLMMPIVLIGQSVQPYKRVFSFYGVCVGTAAAFVIYVAIEKIKKEKVQKVTGAIIAGVFALAAVAQLSSDVYKTPLAGRENDIKAALDNIDVSDVDSIFYTDDFQRFVLQFYYDSMPEETSLQEAKYVLLSTEYVNCEFEVPQWPILYSSDGIDREYLEKEFEREYSDEKYIIYKKK